MTRLKGVRRARAGPLFVGAALALAVEFVTFGTMTKRILVPAPHEGMPDVVATMRRRNGGALRRGGPGTADAKLSRTGALAHLGPWAASLHKPHRPTSA